MNHRILSETLKSIKNFLGLKIKNPELPVCIKRIPRFSPEMEFSVVEQIPNESYSLVSHSTVLSWFSGRFKGSVTLDYSAPAILMRNPTQFLQIIYNRESDHTLVRVRWGGIEHSIAQSGYQLISNGSLLTDSEIYSAIRYFRKLFKIYSV